METLVAIDIETTGLDPDKEAVIEIGAVRSKGHRVEAEFNTLIHPGRRIPPFITQLTNLEIYRFAVVLGAGPDRTLTVSTLVGSLLSSGANRGANWYTGAGTTASFDVMTQANIFGATINVVPTPGAIALMGMGGLLAARRRRA